MERSSRGISDLGQASHENTWDPQAENAIFSAVLRALLQLMGLAAADLPTLP